MKTETFFDRSKSEAGVSDRMLLLTVGLTAVALLAIYWSTAYPIYSIWKRSETFAHGFVVVPIMLWLLWRDREALKATPVRPFFAALVVVAGAGLVWMSARLATIPVASQFGLLLILQFSVITIVGLRMGWRIGFPLAFLTFAVPFGEFLLPWLIDRTADATVALLKASGVPVYREGSYLQIPSGPWSVVEACSGLRYLIASLVAGTLYAYVRYRSLLRRLAFIAAAIAVPLVANWLRAYGIVMLAHYSNNKLGTDIDHIVYGWLFFGLVMALLFYIGSFWEEPRDASVCPVATTALQSPPTRPSPAILLVAGLLCIVVSAAWPAAFAYLSEPSGLPHPSLPQLRTANGWTPDAAKIADWQPRFVNPASELSQQFSKNEWKVGVHIAFYRDQKDNSKLVSSQNVLIRGDDANWRVTAEAVHRASSSGSTRDLVISNGRGARLAVRRSYWVDGRYTDSTYIAAALILVSQLTGHGDDSAAIVMYSPISDQESSSAALDVFASDMTSALSQMLTGVASQR